MSAAEVPVPPAVEDSEALARLIEALDGGNGATRYIGGWVRDTLLGLAPQDIDIATRLVPEQAFTRARATGLQVWSSPSGLAHGTIGVVIAGRTIEVTTLRRDVATDGRHAEVAFTDDWREDAARRDFTINALSADPLSGAVHDYFGGLADLADGCVRFIGDPATRIAEDHLRILRFFRFHARYGRGAAPHAESYAACVARARDLMALSRERVAGELLKLLAVADPVPAIEAMLAGGILAPVLPEIVEAQRLAALITTEREAGIGPDGLRRLAALLPEDAEIAERVGARLRLSNTDRKRLIKAARPVFAPPEVLVYTFGNTSAVDMTLLMGMPDRARIAIDWQAPRLPISGGDLIKLGLTPGPIVATTLQQIEKQWVKDCFPEGQAFDAIVADTVAQSLRAFQ